MSWEVSYGDIVYRSHFYCRSETDLMNHSSAKKLCIALLWIIGIREITVSFACIMCNIISLFGYFEVDVNNSYIPMNGNKEVQPKFNFFQSNIWLIWI
jgi:hypothetical protein